MRPLTEPETKTLFEKLATYCGKGISNLIADPAGGSDRNVFRVQGSRVYYVRSSLANLATSVARDNLLSLGICLGKFTKTGKFRLHITALSIIAPHARYKVWVKQNGEMPFLYGGNVLKAHVGRWSEDCPEHAGVVVLSMNDTPLVSRLRSAEGALRALWLTLVHRDSGSPREVPPRQGNWIRQVL
ncbi:ribosome biosynthesis protein nip7 [Plenodomus lindquistii]|nr:ribosome biosynthesis protein nip7 [Plenodomus lindquistii]